MQSQEFIMLSSPPASGKTFWIESFATSFNEAKIIVISPLRALRNELLDKWGEAIQVMTPEEWLIKEEVFEVVIFDEIHLFFYWGDEFRERMWDCFYGLSSEAHLIIGLTATFPDWMQLELTKFFSSYFWINFGNQELKYLPTSYLEVPSRDFIESVVFISEKGSQTSLIFCQYREEVLSWEKKLLAHGFSVVICLGGEASKMKERLQLTPTPHFIVATTVLSHGVNLPTISKVFFTYEVLEKDFWIQMVARGGRRGERFDVISLKNSHQKPRSKILNHLAIFILSLKIELYHLVEQKCFLKD